MTNRCPLVPEAAASRLELLLLRTVVLVIHRLSILRMSSIPLDSFIDDAFAANIRRECTSIELFLIFLLFSQHALLCATLSSHQSVNVKRLEQLLTVASTQFLCLILLISARVKRRF